MPTIDEEFETLGAAFVDTFADATAVTLRYVSEGAINTTTLKRTPTDTDYAVTAVRSQNRQPMQSGKGGGGQAEEFTFTFVASRVTALGATRPPRAGDKVVVGTKVYRVVETMRETNEKLWKVRVLSDRSAT